jgi:hypothetical protein
MPAVVQTAAPAASPSAVGEPQTARRPSPAESLSTRHQVDRREPAYARRVGYRLLTTAILGLHFAFVAYAVLGGFLAWRWPRTIWTHLAAGAWGFVVIAASLTCPLTYAEDWSRQRAGEPGLTKGFIDRYIEGVVYPERLATLMQVLAATAVVVSWVGFVLKQRRRPQRDGAAAAVRVTGGRPPRRRTGRS